MPGLSDVANKADLILLNVNFLFFFVQHVQVDTPELYAVAGVVASEGCVGHVDAVLVS